MLISSTCLSSSSHPRQEGKLTLHCKVVNYLLAMYAIHHIIAETYIDNIEVKQPASQEAPESVQSPWTKALRCRLVYDESCLKETCRKGLGQLIAQSVQSCLARPSPFCYKISPITLCSLSVHTQASQRRNLYSQEKKQSSML